MFETLAREGERGVGRRVCVGRRLYYIRAVIRTLGGAGLADDWEQVLLDIFGNSFDSRWCLECRHSQGVFAKYHARPHAQGHGHDAPFLRLRQ